MAIALAEAGADVIGVSASLEMTASNVETQIGILGRNFYPYQCDFAKRENIYQFITEVKKNHSCIDILVNNAGTILREPISTHKDEFWDEVISINQTAPFILSREFGKEMISRGSGKIIFIASLLSFQGGVTVPSYAASKGSVASLTKAFANEWASKGINVNAIAPGYIATDNTSAIREDNERKQQHSSENPRWRMGQARGSQRTTTIPGFTS